MRTLFATPLITEKSMAMAGNGTYQFVVPTWATKRQIAMTIGERFGVTVEAVNTASFKQEAVVFKRQPGTRGTYKKATLKLKAGDSIADFSLPTETASTAAPSENKIAPEPTIPAESTITVRQKGKKGGA